MKLSLVAIGLRNASRSSPFDDLVDLYQNRTAAYAAIETENFRSTTALFDSLDRQKSRTPAILVLLDSRGKQLSSEDLAVWIGRQRDQGQQRIVFAIGPADGWTDEDRRRAQLLLSFGPMTLPHELARVVLSEQVYRAFTILAGHPYHSGH